MPVDREEADDLRRIHEILVNLDSRISRIERELRLEPTSTIVPGLVAEVSESSADTGENLELRIGLYWFAKVGIIALMTGVVFLLLQPYHHLPPIFAPLLGFVLSGGVFAASRFLKNTSPLLAGYLLGGSLVLAFFSTLRLHYFSLRPILEQDSVEIFLLLVVSVGSLIVSLRQKSIYLVSVSLAMIFASGVASDDLYAFYSITLIVAAVSVYFRVIRNWPGVLIFAMALTYLVNLDWFINNPLIGNQVELRTVPFASALMVLVWAVLYSIGNVLRNPDSKEDMGIIMSSLLNASFAYVLFFFMTAAKFQDILPLANIIASSVFLALAILFWSKENSRFQTFFYAMTGYAALSVAIVAGFKTPDFFILLCWQSLLVVSTAVWFRSKFIVVANFVIYSLIFVIYLVVAGKVSATSLSFGVVALLSARVLSWQRDRLDLKTDKMRTAYLTAAFVIVPYALYNTVPTGYVSLSWLVVAIVYYIISMVLKNAKYRWMALLTFLLTALYLVIIGIIHLEPVLRIVSFLILGIVLLAISFLYARARAKTGSRNS